ncbi:MAG: hypothetical protein EBV06_05730 [Planctomycetia bacterium]|nr:hypothetical protein [Planctomycetia bacterium]
MRKLWLLLPAGVVLVAILIRNPAVGQTETKFGTLRTNPPAASATALPAGVEPAATTTVANPFPLTTTAGPWLICAAHFPGTEGMDLAIQTVNDLRTKHRYQAFILNRGEEERRKQDAEWEEVKKRLHGAPARRRMIRIEDEYAVLIGGFNDLQAATTALPKIRSLPIPRLATKSGASPFAEMFYTVPEDGKAKVMTAKVNPYTQAMVVRNPIVPAGVERPKVDPFLKKLNADEEYSLLRNSKPYTLLVKEYSGGQSVQSLAGGGSGSSLLNPFGWGPSSAPLGEGLAAAAAQAHELARVLRDPRIGLDAYVLHTRRNSMVAVGGFDSPSDAGILNTVRKINSMRFNPQNGGGDPIGLLANPLIIEVPRP